MDIERRIARDGSIGAPNSILSTGLEIIYGSTNYKTNTSTIYRERNMDMIHALLEALALVGVFLLPSSE
jgi:hypothetical protein